MASVLAPPAIPPVSDAKEVRKERLTPAVTVSRQRTRDADEGGVVSAALYRKVQAKHQALEKTVAWLQSKHAESIHDLHVEIKRLQNICSGAAINYRMYN